MRVDPNFAAGLVTPLNQTQANEQTLTAELASGLRVNAPGDDPVAAAGSVQLAAQASAEDSFVRTAQGVEGRMQAADSALGSVATQMTQAVQLATEAANGGLSASDLQAVGQQLAAIRDSVLGLANSSYEGSYLFAGSKTNTQPYTLDTTTTPATAVYSGDGETETVTSPTGQAFAVNVAGSSVFSNGGADVFAALNAVVTQLQSGSAATTAQVSALGTALGNVSEQRAPLDAALSAMESAVTYTQTASTATQAAESQMVSADTTTVAAQLSQAETQGTALINVLSSLEKMGTLFDYLH